MVVPDRDCGWPPRDMLDDAAQAAAHHAAAATVTAAEDGGVRTWAWGTDEGLQRSRDILVQDMYARYDSD